jgi:hypothetical protein
VKRSTVNACLSLLLAAALSAPLLHAQDTTLVAELRPLSFLLGTWVGEGSGSPGSGAGVAQFMSEVGGRVIVRRNHAEYPVTAERGAFVHDDYMMVYRNPDATVKAVYSDNEGHVILYTVSSGARSVTFTSDSTSPGPRYRLVYRKTGDATLVNTFEIAPPGKPNAFSVYVQGTLRKK